MDIEKIVEKRLKKYKTMLAPIGENNDDVLQGDIKDIASQISSDIKKELKLIASGKVENVGLPSVGIYKNNQMQSVDISEYDGKKINVWIEEIDE